MEYSTSTQRDSFDRLPDDVVLTIFDKLRDARSICVSMSVCKRFRSVAPRAVDIYLPLPHKKRRGPLKHQPQTLAALIIKTLIFRPLHLISKFVKPKSKPEPEDENDLAFYSHQVPNRILRPFQEIRALHLRLPCNGCHRHGINKSTPLLKWKADFGRELHSCVILGARSWSDERGTDDSPTRESRFLAEDDLKLRIVWTISCLIAASARHHLVKETVRALEKVESVVVSDESGQGRLCMNREEIMEMKGMKVKRGDYVEGCCSSEYRSRVPALRMKMWYLETVEAAGKVMEGATLVVIRPALGGEGGDKGDADMVAGAFGEDEKGIDEAVRKLMVAKKCYTLEMNSF